MDFEKLIQAIGELDETTMIEELNAVMAAGGTQATEAIAACQKGMDIVGQLFEEKVYFASDLFFAGEMMTEAVQILKPALVSKGGTNLGKMLICTVEGDMHDIGKNIVRAMLEAAGFDVIDLGIDTSVEKIVQTVKAENLHIVALSGVLTLAVSAMDKTIKALRAAGLNVKVIVGGCAVNEAVCKEIAADAWAYNPQDTVRICKEWALD